MMWLYVFQISYPCVMHHCPHMGRRAGYIPNFDLSLAARPAGRASTQVVNTPRRDRRCKFCQTSLCKSTVLESQKSGALFANKSIITLY